MEVLESIKPQNTAELTVVFEKLYERAFPLAARFVRKMGGSLEDAKDIFQDALVIYYEKNLQGELIVNTTPETYILGISKHLWIRKFKKDRNKVSLSDWEHEISLPQNYFGDVNSNLLLKFLEQTGKKCLDLLRAFYYPLERTSLKTGTNPSEKLSMKDIAKMLGYKNERSATVQKYKCIEKVRDTIKEKSIGYEDFTE